MIRSPLQPHRTRVPAIPPSTRAVKLQWQFEMPDWEQHKPWEQDQPPEWRSFLSSAGIYLQLPVKALHDGRWADIKQVFLNQGANLQCDIQWPAGAKKRHVTLTVTRPARLSPKLLATFPWKLRKHQPQPKGL